jgi:hypothetical protein
MPTSVAGLGNTMKQNNRRALAYFHVVLPDTVGADRMALILGHDEILNQLATAMSKHRVEEATLDHSCPYRTRGSFSTVTPFPGE